MYGSVMESHTTSDRKRRLFAIPLVLLACAVVVVVMTSLPAQASEVGAVELDEEPSGMKTIDKLLARIHKITHPDSSSSSSSSALKSSDDDSSSSSSSSSSNNEDDASTSDRAASASSSSSSAAATSSDSDSDNGLTLHVHSTHHHDHKAEDEVLDALRHHHKKVDPQVEKKKKISKAQLAAKMNALRKQIESDFSSVTKFGHKAGYLPPIKPVKM